MWFNKPEVDIIPSRSQCITKYSFWACVLITVKRFIATRRRIWLFERSQILLICSFLKSQSILNGQSCGTVSEVVYHMSLCTINATTYNCRLWHEAIWCDVQRTAIPRDLSSALHLPFWADLPVTTTATLQSFACSSSQWKSKWVCDCIWGGTQEKKASQLSVTQFLLSILKSRSRDLDYSWTSHL